MIYTQNAFTNDVIDEDYYRLRMPSEVKTYELNSVIFSGQFYKLSDFENILSDTKSEVLLYHEINKPTNPGIAQRRLIEHIRSVYYRNDLTAALPLHQLESLGLPFEKLSARLYSRIGNRYIW